MQFWNNVVAFVEKYVYFTYPFGWEELSALATFAAVIVALFSNRNANKQLKSALRIQEQSKNIDLFDKRMGIICQVEENRPINDRVVQILFSEEIYDCYKLMIQFIKNEHEAQSKMNTYKTLCMYPDGEGGYFSSFREFTDFETELARQNYPEELENEFIGFCKEKEVVYQINSEEKPETYNYWEISQEIDKARTSCKKQKELLLSMMQKYIQDTLKPVN